MVLLNKSYDKVFKRMCSVSLSLEQNRAKDTDKFAKKETKFFSPFGDNVPYRVLQKMFFSKEN